jgi:hypothetical protein
MRFLQLLSLTALVASTAPGQTQRDKDYDAAVPVRFSEGTTHGFLQLSTPSGKKLANGDLLATVRNGLVTSRMVFHFADNSFFEETVTFSQNGKFSMRDYHLVHNGPAFPFDIDARLSRSGRYNVVTTEHDDDGDPEVDHYEGSLELPPDTYNGMVITIAKNLSAGTSRRVHIVAFTPKPMLIQLEYVPAARETVAVGMRRESARHFILEPKLGGLTSFLARLVGKDPPDSHTWIVTDDVPAFLRFEGPLFTGPVWQIELATPELRKG